MTQLASIIVGRRRVQTRHALVCSTGGSAHRYELFCLQSETPRRLTRTGPWLSSSRFVAAKTIRNLHSPNRNPIDLTASAANASGSVQTTLSKLPRRHRPVIPALLLRGSPDRDLSFMRTQLISCRLPKADSALLRSSLFHHLCRFVSFFVRWISVGEGVPLPRPRIQVVHGTVPQKCARNTLPARSGILYRPAIEGLRCHPLPTSSTRAPEVTPN